MQAAGHGSLANHDQVGEPPLVRENIWVPVEGCGGLPGPTGTQRLNPCQKDSWLKDSLPKGFDLNPCQKDGSLTHKRFVQLSHCQNYFFLRLGQYQNIFWMYQLFLSLNKTAV
jgi:hypothetical protein